MKLLALLLLGVLTGLTGLDFLFELLRRRSIGQRLSAWARHYPLYAAGLVGLMGAVLAHFLWQPPP